jgi:Na+/H+ antiporter NhaD/arsenite permease-like protein
MPYCPRCGAEVDENDEYCLNCQHALREGRRTYRRRRERNEKREKQEKNEKETEKREKEEKNEREGGIIGGLIILWLGVSFLLANARYVSWINWWPLFMLGLGLILLLNGLILYIRINKWEPALGFLIGGLIVALIGVSNFYNIENWWAFILILVGVWVVFNAIRQRERNPVP